MILWASDGFAAAPAPLPFEKRGLEALARKDYGTCAAIFAQAARERPFDADAPFAAASCFSRLEENGKAERYLKIAFERGYRDCARFKSADEFARYQKMFAGECDENEEVFLRHVNAELLYAFEDDQAERESLESKPQSEWPMLLDRITRHDVSRRHLVQLMLERKLVRSADDYYHAAMIMQHGRDSTDYAAARRLAHRAVELRPWFADARWLYAAATDRYLQSTGKPQIFGTQYGKKGTEWTLEPFDPKASTDAERARWRVPSLRERLDFIANLNNPKR